MGLGQAGRPRSMVYARLSFHYANPKSRLGRGDSLLSIQSLTALAFDLCLPL